MDIPLLSTQGVSPDKEAPAGVRSPATVGATSSSSQSVLTTSTGTSNKSASSAGDGSERYCADLACINFLRSPPAQKPKQQAPSTPKPLLSQTMQRRMAMPSIQRQVQAVIRLQCWWRGILAHQHYQTMQVCRQLLQQLQPQTAYRELQSAVAALQVKTQQQLSNVGMELHYPAPEFHSGTTTSSGEDIRRDQDHQSEGDESVESTSVQVSEDPLLKEMATKAYASNESRHSPRRKSRKRPKHKPTKEMLALDTIYALQLALENTSPCVYFSRQELLSPHKEVIIASEMKEKKMREKRKLKEKRQLSLEQAPVMEPSIIDELPAEAEVAPSNSVRETETPPLEEATSNVSGEEAENDSPSTPSDEVEEQPNLATKATSSYGLLRFFGFGGGSPETVEEEEENEEDEDEEEEEEEQPLLESQSQKSAPLADSSTTARAKEDVIMTTSSASLSSEEEEQPLLESQSQETAHLADSVLREDSATTARAKEDLIMIKSSASLSSEEVLSATSDPSHSRSESPNHSVSDSPILPSLLVTSPSQSSWPESPATTRSSSSATSSSSSSSSSTSSSSASTVQFPSFPLPRLPTAPRIYSREEIRATNEIQQWLRQRMIERHWETLRVCSTILQTVQYASQTTPTAAARASLAALPYPELQHAIHWLQAKSHRQVSVRGYLRDALQQEVAVRTIQQWYRKHSLHCQLETELQQQMLQEWDENDRYVAALTIQDWWKGFDLQSQLEAQKRRSFVQQRQARREVLEREAQDILRERQRLGRAAAVLQTWWRQCSYMTKLEEVRQQQQYTKSPREIKAPIQVIQSGQGGKQVDSALADDVSSIASSSAAGGEDDGASCQSQDRWLEPSDSAEAHPTAMSAQSSDRLVDAGPMIIPIDLTEVAVKTIQAWHRGLASRAQLQRLRCSSACIQRAWKSQKERGLARGRMRTTMSGIVTIQRTWKVFRARRVARLRMQATVKGVTRLQARYRGQSHQKRHQQLLRGTIQLQAHHRRRAAGGQLMELQDRLQQHRNQATVLLQSTVRGFLGRAKWQQQRAASSLIQSICRGARMRKTYQSQLAGALLLQNWARQQLAMEKLRTDKRHRHRAATNIQRMVRGLRARQNLNGAVLSVVTIQARWRMLLASSEFRMQQKACISIQSSLRRHSAKLLLGSTRQQRAEQERLQQAMRASASATVIQTCFRGALVRHRVTKQHVYAAMIQASWKTHTAYVMFNKQKAVAITIQSLARRLWAINLSGSLRSSREALQAAVVLQSWWRNVSAARCYQKEKIASIMIQSIARRTLATAFAASTKDAKRGQSATTIQSRWRSALASSAYKRLRAAAILIQSSVRRQSAATLSDCLRSTRETQLVKRHDSATTIQSRWRSTIAVSLYKRQQAATIHIQSVARRQSSTTLSNSLRSAKGAQLRDRSAVVIQSWWRGVSAAGAFQRQKTSSTKIQSLARRGSSVSVANALAAARRRETNQCIPATTIQSKWRSAMAAIAFKKQQAASIMIQSLARRQLAMAWSGNLRSARDEQLRDSSAVVLQSWWRSAWTAGVFNRQKDSSIMIQSFARAASATSLARSLAAARVAKLYKAATTIQSRWRSAKDYHAFKQQQVATIMVQSLARRRSATGLSVSLRSAREEQLREKSTVLIQSWWRSTSAAIVFQRQKVSSLKIQSLARRGSAASMANTLAASRDAKLYKSATTIQSKWRSARAFSTYKSQQAATILIQSVARRQSATALSGSLRSAREAQTREESIIVLQSWWRSVLATTAFQKQKISSIKIQSLARQASATFFANNLVAARDAKVEASATAIQSYWRLALAACMYKRQQAATVLIQSVARRQSATALSCSLRSAKEAQTTAEEVANQDQVTANSEISESEGDPKDGDKWEQTPEGLEEEPSSDEASLEEKLHELQKQVNSEVADLETLEVSFRAELERMALGLDVDACIHAQGSTETQDDSSIRRNISFSLSTSQMREESVIVLQSWWRCDFATATFQKQKTSSIKIQSLARMRISLVAAAHLKAEQSALQFARSATCIQAWWRYRRAFDSFVQYRTACVVIQSLARQHSSVHLTRMLREVRFARAAVVLQTWLRAITASRQYARKRHSISTIQSIARQRSSVLLARQLRAETRVSGAAIVIQRVSRGFVTRRKNLVRRESAIQLQAFWRMQMARALCALKRLSSVRLQALVRRELAREKYFIAQTAVLRLQTTWRRAHSEMKYNRQWLAATQIQRLQRKAAVRRSYLILRLSAVRLQSSWRKFEAQRQFLSLREACQRIQATSRQFLIRKDFVRQRSVISKVQSLWRRNKAMFAFHHQMDATIKLQSTVRLFLSRQRYHVMIHSARIVQASERQRQATVAYQHNRIACILLQASIRRYVQSKAFSLAKVSAIRLQAVLRRTWCQRAYDRKRMRCVSIQARFRAWLASKNYSVARASVILIQSHVRRLVDRIKYRTAIKHVVQIQTTIRRNVVLGRYKSARVCSIALQAAWRKTRAEKQFVGARQAARKIQRFWRPHFNRNTACALIQRVWKNHHIRVLARRQGERHHQLIVLFQSKVRSWLARRQLQRLLGSAVALQSFARMSGPRSKFVSLRRGVSLLQCHKRMRVVAARYRQGRHSARCLQSWWRMAMHHQLFLRKRMAACLLQSTYRRHSSRQSYLATRRSVIKCQAIIVRAWSTRRRLHSMACASRRIEVMWLQHKHRQARTAKLHQSATSIQSWYRSSLAASSYKRQQAAMIQIQSMARRHSATTLAGALRAVREAQLRNGSATALQSWWRTASAATAFQMGKISCIKIQSIARRKSAAASAVALMATRHTKLQKSATSIQSWWRYNLAASFYTRQQAASVRIQSVARRSSAAALLRTLRAAREAQEREGSTVVLQCWWRCVYAASFYKRHQAASIRIQSVARRHSAAALLNSLRAAREAQLAMRHKSATSIQTRWRSTHAAGAYKRQQAATVLIQSVARRHPAAALSASLRSARKAQLRRKSAIVLQSWWRSLSAATVFQRQKDSSIKIQSLARRSSAVSVANTLVATRAATVEESATAIQSSWRSAIAAGTYKRQQAATVLIQSVARRQSAMALFGNLRSAWEAQLRDRSAVVLQSWWRCALASGAFQRWRSSSVKIQSLARRSSAASLANTLASQEAKMFESTTTIQSVWRSNLAACAFKGQKAASIEIQAVFRAYLVRRHVECEFFAATIIQLAWINHREVRRAQNMRAKVVWAVIRIQSQVRALQMRRGFLWLKISAVMVQSLVRRTQDRSRFRALLKGCIQAQSLARGRVMRRDYQQLIDAVVNLQCLHRQRRCRAVYLCRKDAAGTIMSHARRWLETKKSKQLQAGAVRIQTWWRSTVLANRFFVLRESTVILQKSIRTFCAKQVVAQMKKSAAAFEAQQLELMRHQSELEAAAASCIQKAFCSWCSRYKAAVLVQRSVRRFLASQRYTRIVIACGTLQSWYRKIHKQRASHLRDRASTTIQSWSRRFLIEMRNPLSHRRRAASLIQERMLGIIARRQFLSKRNSCVLIQCAARKNAAVAVANSRRNASETIQRNLQVVLGRRRVAEAVAVLGSQQRAAVMIQQNVRRGLVRQRNVLSSRLDAVIAIQSMARRFLVNIYDALGTRRSSVVIIQSFAGKYLAQKRRLAETRLAAVVCIQCWVRRWLVSGQGHLVESKKATVLLQSLARGFFVRKEGSLHAGMTAAIKIQAVWRGFVDRAIFALFRSEAIQVQAYIRMHLAHKSFQELKVATATIATFVRGFLARKAAVDERNAKLEAAVAIQSRWRGFVERAIFSCYHFESIYMQANLRMLVARRTYQRCRSAAVTIQAFARMMPARKKHMAWSVDVAEGREVQRASQAAENEVKLLLAGDLPTLRSAGICLRRLVTEVAQFRFLVESEKNESLDALDAFRQVQECYPYATSF